MRIKKKTLNSVIAWCYNMPILFIQFFAVYDTSVSGFMDRNKTLFMVVIPAVMLVVSTIPLITVLLEFRLIMRAKPELVIETTQSKRIAWIVMAVVNVIGFTLIIGFSGMWKLVAFGLILLLDVLFWRSTKGDSGIYDSSIIYKGVDYPFECLESCTVKKNKVMLRFVKPLLFLEVEETIELEGNEELDRFLRLVFDKSDVLPELV